MMTKNILFSGSQAAAVQGAKSKVLSAKPGRDFASVMEQAAGPGFKHKVQSPRMEGDFASSSPRPAHARSTRAVARGRGEDEEIGRAHV